MTRENATAWGLGAIGAAQGALNYYVKPAVQETRPSIKAWGTIIGGVILYDLLCPKGKTLSEGAYRALDRRPILTTAAIGTTALHLMRKLPEQVDPFHQTLKFVKR